MPYVERLAESTNQVPILTMIYCETCGGSPRRLGPHHHRHIVFIIPAMPRHLPLAALSSPAPDEEPMTYYSRFSCPKSVGSVGLRVSRVHSRIPATISFRWYLGFLCVRYVF
jgi:hypothetical protein